MFRCMYVIIRELSFVSPAELYLKKYIVCDVCQKWCVLYVSVDCQLAWLEWNYVPVSKFSYKFGSALFVKKELNPN
jgi:hypothetical protein